MNRLLLITYDLRKPGRNYTPFYEAVKRLGDWWHYLDSTWLLQTSQTPEQVYDALRQHMDVNDQLLVIAVSRPYYGWLPADAWTWISKRIS